MPQLLALEWNESEARIVVASSRGNRVTIEQAFAVPLSASDGADTGREIADALASRRIGKFDTLVAVGRSSIELRLLSLPPAPDDELPEMVRFQAMREFNAFSEDWLLDFLPVKGPQTEQQNVLAAAIGPELVEQIQQTCRTAGLKPQRLILRPCAAAALLARSKEAEEPKLRLLIDLLADEVDLTVMDQKQVVFLRTARIGGDPLEDPSYTTVLLGEIRRTVAAAQNQLAEQRIESVVLCGSGERRAQLAATIHESLSLPVESFDPFADLDLGKDLRNNLPDQPGRFVPLLGMALTELEQSRHAIDFLHPRRRKVVRGESTKYVLAGAVTVMLVAMLFVYGQIRDWQLKKTLTTLVQQGKKLDEDIAKADAAQKIATEIDKWGLSDVTWLDEMYKLSQDFPCAQEAMVTNISLLTNPSGGEMRIDGFALDPGAVTSVDQDLRAAEQLRVKRNKLRPEQRRRSTVPVSGESALVEHYTTSFSVVLFVAGEEQ